MAKIVRYDLNHKWQEMLIDLDVSDKLPDEIKVICNDFVVTYKKPEEDKIKITFGFKPSKGDIIYMLLDPITANQLATHFHNNNIWYYWGT